MFFASLLFASCSLGLTCMSNENYFGYLDPSLVIAETTLARSGTSCQCCAMCHTDPRCRSLTYNAALRTCTLYGRVGGYRSINGIFESEFQFFFMPNSSDSGEFCRSDSDCQTPGDFCSGRICTTDVTVTCRDIYDMNSALTYGRYWFSVAREEFNSLCMMDYGSHGYTMVLVNWGSLKDASSWDYNLPDYPRIGAGSSILRLTDVIRDSGSGSYYQVVARGVKYARRQGVYGPRYVGVEFNVTRDFSLMGSVAREAPYRPIDGAFRLPSGGRVVFPFFGESNGRRYGLNGNQEPGQTFGAILRPVDDLAWASNMPRPAAVQLFIRE